MSSNCYGRIPRENLHEQENRLTTKHIKTLTFLQDIAKENKDLKSKLKDLEEVHSKCNPLHGEEERMENSTKEMQTRYQKQLDDSTCFLTDKHKTELMQKMQEKLVAEEEWAEERGKLLEEIEHLKRKLDKEEASLKSALTFKFRCQDLEAKVGSLEGELEELKIEKSRLRQAHENQLEEIQRLRSVETEKSSILAELQEVLQKNKELQFRLERAHRELGDSGLKQQEDLMTSLRNALTKLHKEKAIWIEKEVKLDKNIADLKDENGKLRRALLDSERMRQEMHGQMEGVLGELYALRKASVAAGDSRTFKDFVQIKRELAQVKEENEELKSRVNYREKSNSLPSLKGSQVQSYSSMKSTSRVSSAKGERYQHREGFGSNSRISRK